MSQEDKNCFSRREGCGVGELSLGMGSNEHRNLRRRLHLACAHKLCCVIYALQTVSLFVGILFRPESNSL